MFKQPQPRMFNNVPRNQLQPNFRWSNPRALNIRYNSFNARPPNNYNKNEEFWCETCDRGFVTVNLLDQHKQQHQKCNIDGCQFVAHPKMITKHIQMQHSSGLYKRLAKLDNPEEIKKWREERKKNFPTKTNIEKKAAELNEKYKRGEKMGLKYDKGRRENIDEIKFKSGAKRKYENKNKQNYRNKITAFCSQTKNTQNNKHPPPQKIPKTLAPLEETGMIKPFRGIQNIIMNNDKDEDEIQLPNDNILIEDDNSDNDSTFKIKEPIKTKEPTVCTALNSLICNYGSSDEDDLDLSVTNKEIVNIIKTQFENDQEILNEQSNEVKENEKSHREPFPDNGSIVIKPNDNSVDDDSGPEEFTIIKENKDEINKNHNQNNADVNYSRKKSIDEIKLRHKNNNICHRPKPKPPSTLLQKLLSKEIRHERNIILQCVRYIIKNNYFGEKTD